MADITHDLAIARWRLLQQGVDHGIAGECEAPVEPRRDREPCLTIGVHAKPAGLHQERVFQCRVVLAAWLRVTVLAATATRQPSFSIQGAIVTGP